MLERIRKQLTYANVIATIALFAALSGGVAWGLTRNSVASRQIAPKAVRASEIAPKAVKSGEIAPKAVRSSEVAPDAIKSSEIASGAAGAGVVMGRVNGLANSSGTAYGAPTGTSTGASHAVSVAQQGPLNGGVVKDFVVYAPNVLPGGASRTVSLVGLDVGEVAGCTIPANTNSCVAEGQAALPYAATMAIEVQTTGSPGPGTVFFSYNILGP